MRLRLGLLPVKDAFIRTANIIADKRHRIWSLTSKTDLKAFLSESFPQLNIDSFVDDKELDKFCQMKSGVFPAPRFSNRMQTLVGPSANRGVVLLGDALHVFPPDLGQGVNSGLEDVAELDNALQEANGQIEPAFEALEKNRLPEIKALCKVMRFAYPYQYNQNPIMSKLYFLNFGLRLALNKLLPTLFSKPAFFLVQDHKIKYSEILFRCHMTTRFFLLGILILNFTVRYLSRRIPNELLWNRLFALLSYA
jgi:2-polyprenyl-6-methoxyphenol hydroxylase-like FAD-dependent oxidoreductase